MVNAAIMYGFNEPLRVESVRLKAPRPDEVVVKIAASGVCHSDLSILRGYFPIPPPLVLGHEGAGVVEEVGKEVTDLKPGDHVVISFVANCGACAYCVAGEHHLCVAGTRVMGGNAGTFEKDGVEIGRLTGVGSFAERTLVRATAAIKIRDDVPFDRACLVGCGVTTGVGAAINTARVTPGQTVAVFGCGGVGLNVVQGAALAGARRIVAVDVVEQKLAWARDFGATDTVHAKEAGNVPDAIRGLTDGLGVDVAFEVIGAPEVMLQAFQSLKRGGKAVIVGIAPTGAGLTVPAGMLPNEGKSIVGSLYGSANVRRDFPRWLDLYMQKKLKIDELVSRRIRLDQVNDALAALERGEVKRSVIVF